MTIYQRPDEKILAESSKQGEVKDFPDISRGWGVAFDKTGGIPPMEWFNALGKRTDEAVRYLLQRGIAEWSKTEDYPVGALVSHNQGIWLAEQSSKGVEPKTNSLWKETALTIEQIRKLIPVNSVNGKMGNVVLNAGDVGALDKLGGVLDGDLHVQKSALAMVRLVTNHQNKFKADLFCNHTFGIATDNGAGGTTTRFRFTPDASKISGVWNFENCNVTKNGVNIPTVNQVANQLVADSTSKQVRYAKIATGRINRIDIGNVSFLVSGANNFGSPNNNLEYVSFSCRTESNKATIIHQIITPSFHPDHQNRYGWVFNAVDNTVELWLKSTSYGGFLGLTRLSGYHPSYISVCDKLIWQDIEPEKIVYVEPSKTISSNDPVIMKGDYGLGSELAPLISDFTDNLPSGFYRALGAGTATPTKNLPPNTKNSVLYVIVQKAGNQVPFFIVHQHAAQADNVRSWVGIYYKGKLTWKETTVTNNFTILYPNGTAQNPMTIGVNTRLVVDNPFPGHCVICMVEVKFKDKWGAPGFIYSSGGHGTAAYQYDDDKIIVQSGNIQVLNKPYNTGSPHAIADLTSAPFRVKVWKVT
ncbi:hypothetical protein SOASR032_08640 [Pragia fontium]|uniref:Tail fiber protein n=1 Tax=Pragia fontium TaxID=82985 RepID=A0ABQ5LFA6_9GAMM|nr:hypothetical protein [Pragia fontium]GKX62295.1 hypothetical protein SOASR032_08640 [Pragia fontium]